LRFSCRRENALPADTSFFVGGKRSVIAASDLKHTHNNDRLGFHHSDNQIKNKRERERHAYCKNVQGYGIIHIESGHHVTTPHLRPAIDAF
jgi:hypothetical protein